MKRMQQRGAGLLVAAMWAACPARAEVIIRDAPGPLPGPAIEVPAELGELRGTSSATLLHTFSVFNVIGDLGESVTFLAPVVPDVSVGTVVARVTGGVSELTGGSASIIDGPLTSAIAGADLFLINPDGVIFGPNAQLSVDGSFHATTADLLRFADGAVVYADPASASTLSTAAPAAFGFLGPNPAAGIRVVESQLVSGIGTLSLADGASLSLVGGSIDIEQGIIGANGNRVNLAAVARPGEARLTATGIEVDHLDGQGSINIGPGNLGGSFIDGDEIVVRAGSLDVDDSVLSPGALFLLGAGVAPDGGRIDVAVGADVRFSGSEALPRGLLPGTYTFNERGATSGTVADTRLRAGGRVLVNGVAAVRSERFGPGPAGSLRIDADALELRDQATVTATNYATGAGPDIAITANTVLLVGDGGSGDALDLPTGLFAQASDLDGFFVTDGGDIKVKADRLEIGNGASISSESFAFGAGGNVMIEVGELVASRDGAGSGAISTQSVIAGDAGSIDIDARTIEIADGFQISATTSGVGGAGSLQVRASETLGVSGTNSGFFSAALDVRSEDLDTYVSFIDQIPDVPTLLSAVGVADLAGLYGFLGIDAAPGTGGLVNITTPVLRMAGDARIDSSTFGDGAAGDVLVEAGRVELDSGAQVRSRSGGIPRGQTVAMAGAGNGGSVTLRVDEGLDIAGRSASGASSAVATGSFGAGAGGQIAIAAQRVALRDGGTINAESSGSGVAGAIDVQAVDQIVLDGGSITTDASVADGGNITVKATELVDLRNSSITTSVRGGQGEGGNIDVDPDFVVLQNSRISANAFGGPGGNIRIVAGNFIIDGDPARAVTASSSLGIDGTVVIDSPESDLSGDVAALAESYLDVSGLLRNRCAAARASEESNSLTVAAQRLPPDDPNGYLPGIASASDLQRDPDRYPERSAAQGRAGEPLRIAALEACSP